MDTKDNDIEVRSEEFREILGDIPSWILRWGIYILGAFILIILIGSSIFKYPDTINTRMILTGTTPAARIVTKSSGKLKELRIKDNAVVSAGSYLAVIENPAKTSDILQLKEYLRKSATGIEPTGIFPPKNLSIGDIQLLYSSFYTILCKYDEFVRQQYYPRKTEALKNRIEKYKNYCENIRKQKDIAEKALAITTHQYLRDSILNVKRVLSQEDLENSQKGLLQSRLSMEGMNATLENTEIQIVQMGEILLDIDNEYKEKRNSLITQLKTLTNQLLTEIQTWEMNYALVAPINGRITFTDYWANNQYIETNKIVFNIVPTEKVTLLGKALLPMERAGKVKIGQKVNIRFDSFPDNEYGVVRGIVQNISLIPSKGNNNQNSYVVDIRLPKGLCTTYNKSLPYMPEMEAKADIVTENLSLLERFIFPIRNILQEAI